MPLTEALVELVRGGLGVTTLPSWVVQRRAGLRSLRITRTGVRRRWSAVRLAGRAPSPAVTDFVGLLRGQVAAKIAAAARRR